MAWHGISAQPPNQIPASSCSQHTTLPPSCVPAQAVHELQERQQEVESKAPILRLRVEEFREQLRDLRISDARYKELKAMPVDSLHVVDEIKVCAQGNCLPGACVSDAYGSSRMLEMLLHFAACRTAGRSGACT